MSRPAAHSAHASTATAVAAAGRIDALDVLRGFAVLGILVVNVQAFAMPGAAYFNPTAYGDLEGTNLHVWVVGRLLADQKFMTIFSMLFGASIVLMTERAEARGDARRAHYRRMGWLLVIGLLHAHSHGGGRSGRSSWACSSTTGRASRSASATWARSCWHAGRGRCTQ